MKIISKLALSVLFVLGFVICAQFGVLQGLTYVIVIFACVAVTL